MMKKLLLPLAILAVAALPATASAEQCRNAKGQFAKCGTPGAVPASQYVAKGKVAPKAVAKPVAPAAGPAMKPASPFGGLFGKKPAATPAPAVKPAVAAAAKPVAAATAAAKKAPCKDAKGKFIKCPA